MATKLFCTVGKIGQKAGRFTPLMRPTRKTAPAKTAPVLPATTLTEACYELMFIGCTSLTTAPVLPATTLVQECYQWMFADCSSLNYIKMLATYVSATDCMLEWVDGVAATGTFVKAQGVTIPSGISGIPDGWDVQVDTPIG